MKHLFAAIWFLAAPLAAEPIVSGDWSIQAEPLEDQRARVEACWRQATESEGRATLWRAALDDQKVEVGATQELGPVQGEATLEQDWQQELEARRASLSLRVPDYHGWDTGVAGEWDWTPDQDQWNQAMLRGWIGAPPWRGWSVRAEVAAGETTTRFTGRLSKQLGPGQLMLEAEQEQSEFWQRRWLTRYQWEIASQARLSAQGGRRWSQLDGNYQDEVEAKLEIEF